MVAANGLFADAEARRVVGSVVEATVMNAVTMALKCKSDGVPFDDFATLMQVFCRAGTELLLEKVRVSCISKPTTPSQN